MRQRKYKTPRKAHRVFLVICEGETEEVYIKLLKSHYRIPIAIKTKVLGNTVNERMVRQYVRELGASVDDCQVLYVYDGDIASVVERIKKLEGRAVISTPCIEIWFALHCRECTHTYSSEDMIGELLGSHRVWQKYVKGTLTADQSAILLDNKDIAVKRARNLGWPGNPSSNMYEFLEILEKEKT